MDKIQLSNNTIPNVTVLSNDFIDRYMAKADGEYVKIFLLLLRLQASNETVTIELLADRLDLTRKDVSRALRYWQNEGLISGISEDASMTGKQAGSLPGEQTRPLPGEQTKPWAGEQAKPWAGEQAKPWAGEQTKPWAGEQTKPWAGEQAKPWAGEQTKPSPDEQTKPWVAESDDQPIVRHSSTPAPIERSPLDLTALTEYGPLHDTIFMIQTYLGKTLTVKELNTLCYIEQELGFSTELLDYLIEFCIDRGKKTLRYIESVAIDWYQEGVDTIEKAKEYVARYTKNVYPVYKAFGLSNRNPAPSELDFINQWNDMGFETDLIIEACNRTIKSIHQPSFQYAHSILTKWFTQGVTSIKDVEEMDKIFKEQTVQKGQNPEALTKTGYGQKNKESKESRPIRQPKPNAFHNFEQDTYDYDEITAKLLARNRRP